MSGWIVKRGEREVPIPDEATLRRWAEEGRFNPSDLIFHPALQRWLYATEVLEIKDAVEKRQSVRPNTTRGPVENQPRVAARPSPVTTEFIVNQDGQQFRAADVATLQRWVDEGRVRVDSYIFHPLLQRWIAAREVSELHTTFGQLENISKLARSYRQLVLWVGAQLLLYLCFQAVNNAVSFPFLGVLFLGLILVTVVALAIYAYRTAEALGSSVAPLWAIAMLIPCINIITLLVLSSKATSMCRARGIPVGFLGPQL